MGGLGSVGACQRQLPCIVSSFNITMKNMLRRQPLCSSRGVERPFIGQPRQPAACTIAGSPPACDFAVSFDSAYQLLGVGQQHESVGPLAPIVVTGVKCGRSSISNSNGTAPNSSQNNSRRGLAAQLLVQKSVPTDGNVGAPLAAAPKRARLGPNGQLWTHLHAKLLQTLRSSRMLDTASVLVAVSGGQDSVCLLQALADLQPRWRWRLGVVHCDHGWRQDSAANAEFVRELAEGRLGLPCYTRVAPPGAAKCERSAREWRYGVFAEVAAAHGYSAVVTAHTATDRAETMLLNLLRGTGPDGLVALARSRSLASAKAGSPSSKPETGHTVDKVIGGSDSTQPVRLVRPLLEFTRDETQGFVQQLRLPYFHDSTNDCNDLRRNLLRNEVLPSLRRQFNPRLDQALFRFMEVLDAEMEYMDGVAEVLYAGVVAVDRGAGAATASGSTDGLGRGSCGASSGGEGAALKLPELRALPLAMQRRVVHKWLRATVAGRRDSGGEAGGKGGAGVARRSGIGSEVSYEDVARCLALLQAPNRTNSDSLGNGLVASVRDGRLVLWRAPLESAAEPGQQRPQQRQRRASSQPGTREARGDAVPQAARAPGHAKPGGGAAAAVGGQPGGASQSAAAHHETGPGMMAGQTAHAPAPPASAVGHSVRGGSEAEWALPLHGGRLVRRRGASTAAVAPAGAVLRTGTHPPGAVAASRSSSADRLTRCAASLPLHGPASAGSCGASMDGELEALVQGQGVEVHWHPAATSDGVRGEAGQAACRGALEAAPRRECNYRGGSQAGDGGCDGGLRNGDGRGAGKGTEEDASDLVVGGTAWGGRGGAMQPRFVPRSLRRRRKIAWAAGRAPRLVRRRT